MEIHTASFITQVVVLTKKNFLLKKRNWKLTVFELAAVALYFGVELSYYLKHPHLLFFVPLEEIESN